MGAIVYKPGSTAIITCILPPSESSVCSTAIGAFVSYENAMSPVGEAADRVVGNSHG